jgi:hypothetical protein
MFGAAMAASVEDAAAAVAAHTPFGRFRRRLLGVALPSSAVVVLWLLIAAAGSLVAGNGELPIGGLLVEVIGLAAAGVALGAAVARIGERGSGTRASVLMVVVVLLTLGHPRSIQWLWAPPGSGPDWTAGRTHWAVVAAAAGAIFAVLSADPARRPLRRRSSA